MQISQETQKIQRERKKFNIDVADLKTLFVSLGLILVSTGEVVFGDCGRDPAVQPRLVFISQPSSQIFWKSG